MKHNIFVPKFPRGRISLRLPFGITVGVVLDRHGANWFPGGMQFGTNLRVDKWSKGYRDSNGVWQKGQYQGAMDLGSGLVTNVGAMALANEAVTLASPSGARINTLFLANQHMTGTGVTAAAATDFKLQTVSLNGGQTAAAGAQTIQNTMAVPKYQTIATNTYTNTEAVTEWGLFTSATLSSTTGTPFTGATATTFTATGTPFTASSSTVQGLQQQIVVPGTTAVLGLIQSNSTSVGTLAIGWFNQSNGLAGSTPGATEAYTLRPLMWDHKVFSALNVIASDTLQWTYQLTIQSGG